MDAPIRNFTLSLYVAVCVSKLFTSSKPRAVAHPDLGNGVAPPTRKHTHQVIQSASLGPPGARFPTLPISLINPKLTEPFGKKTKN